MRPIAFYSNPTLHLLNQIHSGDHAMDLVFAVAYLQVKDVDQTDAATAITEEEDESDT